MASSSISCLLISCLCFTLFAKSDRSSSDEGDDTDTMSSFVSRIAVANRGNGNGLLIESENEVSTLLIELDDNSQPMYISAAPLTNEFYIGDRGNNQFYVYDTTTLKRLDIIRGCNGIFHQYYNLLNQLWIICDIDLNVLVIDTKKRKILTTISINNIENMDGYKPHDVITNTEYAFISLLKPGDSTGYIIQYETKTFSEVNRISIGGDPHLWLNTFDPHTNYLYVASQTVGLVYKINIDTLQIMTTLSVNGAHGIWGTPDSLYVTDITSVDGTNALYVIHTDKFDTITPLNAVKGAAHNLMINSGANKLFVTHSGIGVVSVYDIKDDGGLDSDNGRIIFEKDGTVPFGIMNIIGIDEFNYLSNHGN